MNKNYPTLSFRFLSLLVLVLLSNFIQAQTTTWNGSAWDNGTPDITKDVIFSGNFVSSGDIETKSVSVSNTAQVDILSNNTLTVANNIDVASDSNLIFENNASLLQTNALAVNTGNIHYKRNSTPIRQYEYTYWSSPVDGQKLVDFSPNTDYDRFYSYNSTPGVNNWVGETYSNVMTPKGYAIRIPDSYDPIVPSVFNGEFIGTPNNGNIQTNVVAFNPGLKNYNLIGNPYPSAISLISLLDNSNIGAMYFWTHNTSISSNVFTQNDYAVRTRTVGTAAVSGGAAPGLYIAAGQGFFASTATTTTLTFTNSMRVGSNNAQFYKNARTVPLNYYIHLNLTNTLGAFKQIAIGYEEGATNGYDFGTDALASEEGPITFYSLINSISSGFGIQGREYPWNVNDVIDLGISTTVAGDYTIAIDHENLFFDDKDVFIKDLDLGVYHNLKTSSYTFTTAVGTFNNRFKIVYIDPTLSSNAFVTNPNTVLVNTTPTEIIINSTSEKIKNIQIYDVLGRLIFTKEKANENKITINSIAPKNQALIVKMELENNQVVSKKLIF